MRISYWSSDVCSSDLLAASPRHAAIGEQRDAKALVLQDAARRGQLVHFRHAVGARALEADDDDGVAVEFARLDRRAHLLLVVEDAGRRSEVRRVGKECGGTCRSWGSPVKKKKK